MSDIKAPINLKSRFLHQKTLSEKVGKNLENAKMMEFLETQENDHQNSFFHANKV